MFSKEKIIKLKTHCLGKIVFLLMCCIMGMMTVMLFVEYRYFHNQAMNMIERKHEYESYTRALKKKLQGSGSYLEVEAASSNDQIENNVEEFPEFLMLNREPGYLKQSTINYFTDQKLDHALKNVDLNLWSDDTQITTKAAAKKAPVKKNAPALKRKAPIQKPRRVGSDGGNLGTPDIYLAWPIERSKFWLSSPFGPRKKPDGSWGYHYGIDMAAIKGTPVKSVSDGQVIEVQRSATGYGNTIVIQANNKYKMRYAHLDTILVKNGQNISRGQLIGKVGDTGLVRKKGKDASHLHFELYLYGKQINPLYFFM